MNQDNSQIELLQEWGKYGLASNLVEKALTSALNVGQALTPQSLEKEMTLTIQRLSPEMSIYMKYGKMQQIGGKFHEFNQTISLPQSGSIMGESTTTPATNSTYQRNSVTLKIARRKGQVTDFVLDVSREFVDTMRVEADNQIKTMIWDLATSLYFGNPSSNAFDFGGLEYNISTLKNGSALNFAGTNFNIRGGVAIQDLRFLDSMIDASNRKGGSHHPRAIFTSPEMISAITRYETTIRKIVELGGGGASGKFGEIDIPGGHRLETYRGIPLVGTTGLSPVETMTPTITLAQEDTGVGSLSNGTYRVMVAPVTNQGEQLASASQTVSLTAGTATQRIKITLSATHAGAQYYKIYVSNGAVGTETLVRMVTALFYSDSIGTLDLSQFNGQSGTDIFVAKLTGDTTITAQMVGDPPLVASGGVNPEYLILQDLDPIQGLGKIVYANIMTGGVFSGLITTKPLAQVDAYQQFMMYSHLALVPSYEATSSLIRGIRAQ